MNPNRTALFVICLGVLAGPPAAFGYEGGLVTAVYSKVSRDYFRPKMPDGSPRRETYAFAVGNYQPGMDADKSIDNISFPTIAGVVAHYMATRNYFLTQDAKSPDLLVLVTWGKTLSIEDITYRNSVDELASAMNQANGARAATAGAAAPGGRGTAGGGPGGGADSGALDAALTQMQMANDARMRELERNARILGYAHDIYQKEDDLSNYAGAGTSYWDMVSDVEEERYYVIIDAFDFRAAKEQKKRKILWSTRVSIRAHGNQFDQKLAQMIAYSAGFFGKGSGSLMRDYHPQGKVEIGELKDMGVVPAPAEKPAQGSRN